MHADSTCLIYCITFNFCFATCYFATKTDLFLSFKSVKGLWICDCFTVFLTWQKPQVKNDANLRISHGYHIWEKPSWAKSTRKSTNRSLTLKSSLSGSCSSSRSCPIWLQAACDICSLPQTQWTRVSWKIPRRAFWVTDSEIFVGFKP